ncbi:MAG: tRNA(m(1)G37)methyltransferase [Trizodia sp. TS-e1964]|nr:MAG: tRNA(m(1)G37)methyltransferase [Trizodia sp. TS-e1964]
MSLFRPPVNRTMQTLDRSYFAKSIPLSAVRVLDNSAISKYRSQLEKSKELLKLERITPIRCDPEADPQKNQRCLLLRPEVRHDDSTTWSVTLRNAVMSREISLLPYMLELDYKHWSYYDIMSSILPEDEKEGFPTGFSIVGHVAHINLRDQYLPYKSIIAEVLIDKNKAVKTVINKIDDVGAKTAYRTFAYEVLAGSPDLNVLVKEEDCYFEFDFSKVYWNSRLHTEHRRLVSIFKEGEIVCDVMAGVGPFAIPAGKKRVFVWANDLNPDSYKYLQEAIDRNKVSKFVTPFNADGHEFIRDAARKLFSLTSSGPISVDINTRVSKTKSPTKSYCLPRTFDHFVLNLPASAITFLPSFVGLYKKQERLFHPFTVRKLPLIHLYIFGAKSEDVELSKEAIYKDISAMLGWEVTGDDAEMNIWDVRDVAPLKRMFCASFRLPSQVAFRDSSVKEVGR